MAGPLLNRQAPSEEAWRVASLVCAVVQWLTYLYIVSTPGIVDRSGAVKGWDFPQFYALGTLAADGSRTSLADGFALDEVVHHISPVLASERLAPVYGPQIALFFAPLAGLSYGTALALWLLLSAALYALCCVLLWRSCPSLEGHWPTAALLALASPAFVFLLWYAQLSAVALALFTAAFLALKGGGRRFLAGVAIGSLVYKPQLGLAMGIVFLAAGEWRVVAGAFAGAGAQLLVAWAYAGTSVMRAYVYTLTHLYSDISMVQQKTHLLQSITSFFELLIPWHTLALALSLTASLAVLWAAWRVWTSDRSIELRYAMLLIATVLVSPHFYLYDLVILTPAGFLVADRLLRGNVGHPLAATYGLVLLYIAPLISSASALRLGLQPTVPILCLLAYAIGRRTARSREEIAFAR